MSKIYFLKPTRICEYVVWFAAQTALIDPEKW